MEKNIAFIWDLDGTLFDSYDAILAGLEETYEHFGLDFDRPAIKEYILKFSVKDLIKEVADKEGLDYDDMQAFRANSLREKNAAIHLMPGARDVLDWTVEQGISNFVYTHKGKNTHQLLQNLGIATYFKEVLTADSGFARKPDPEALNYLIETYRLEKDSTYYVGDRLLDVQTALRAGIGSINLVVDTIEKNQKIICLSDILGLF
ncbi:HAD-superfamily hydrolase [Streptococcus varani]|uniref:HAD-superfamily hydrolase n=1 Tax=Streptococcus varani TaxID=1608583 RepID=A0A0E4H6F5_9STRE|nr:HAD-IA family hydrolase [Streptococcus varani]CQR26130.1 HAD-superfamily hydrolase [Streptococcus varani]